MEREGDKVNSFIEWKNPKAWKLESRELPSFLSVSLHGENHIALSKGWVVWPSPSKFIATKILARTKRLVEK